MGKPVLGDGSSVKIDLDAPPPARPQIRTPTARLEQMRDHARDDAERLRNVGAGLVTTRPVPASGGLLDQVKGYTIPMPRRVNQQLEEEARRQGVPKKVIVLKALKAAGFDVRDGDLEDRRGIVMKQVSAARRGGSTEG
ncbi:MAG: hypothetical protein HQL40_04615 [Alphaproteobacteria bacterium]|nr:hypothetical protein [Alphaproteobacteria bacterium]